MSTIPVKIAVASTATIAKDKAIPALNTSVATQLVGVSSRDKERAQAFADEHNAGTGFTHDELLDTGQDVVEAIYTPLPSGVRNDYMKKVLNTGKHVYSEKPHGGSVNELKEVLDLAKAKNLQWMDGTMWYHSMRTKAMEEEILRLGQVRRVAASFSWGGGGLVDQAFIDGGNGRTDPKREPYGMLGDSGHYPICAVAWAFKWELPVKVQALHSKKNKVGALITCEAYLWFKDGGRAIIDTSCECPHRSQFEVVCDKGVVKVDDLVGGQGRTGNFGAYANPFVGSASYVVGDHLGKDKVVEVQPCDHELALVERFALCVRGIRDEGKGPDAEWGKRALVTHTIMCSIFESAMRGGAPVELKEGKFSIGEETFNDIPTRNWHE